MTDPLVIPAPRIRLLGGRLEIDPVARQVFLGRRRLHHGLTGVLLVAAGIAAAVHDRRDARVWLSDLRGCR